MTTSKKANPVLLVQTNCPDGEPAARLAAALVDARLAACANVLAPCAPIYRWQGKDCEEPEVRLVIKTAAHCEGALQALFASRHPYDVPQFLVATLRASEAYARWVRSETQAPAAPGSGDAEGAGGPA